MFASIKMNAILSGMVMTGCYYSPQFAATVVAGALGAFIAALVIFGIHGGPNHPFNIMVRKSRELIRL